MQQPPATPCPKCGENRVTVSLLTISGVVVLEQKRKGNVLEEEVTAVS
jgi:hypothetical protein